MLGGNPENKILILAFRKLKEEERYCCNSLVFIKFLNTILMIEKPIYIETFFFVL